MNLGAETGCFGDIAELEWLLKHQLNSGVSWNDIPRLSSFQQIHHHGIFHWTKRGGFSGLLWHERLLCRSNRHLEHLITWFWHRRETIWQLRGVALRRLTALQWCCCASHWPLRMTFESMAGLTFCHVMSLHAISLFHYFPSSEPMKFQFIRNHLFITICSQANHSWVQYVEQ